MNRLLSKISSSFAKRRWYAGRYRLVRRLGSGGMAEVWLAERDDGRAVAIKRILPHLEEDASVRLCFRDEAQIGRLLKHDHLVRQVDHGYVGKQPYIAMDYVDGISLRELTERAQGANTALPLGLCLRVIAEVAEGLHHAHNATDAQGKPLNLIHRDVSPDNILLDAHGVARLTDFGVARADCNQRVTANGSLCGKLGYMGPQQASAERIDHRADQFSLAVVLYELVARRRLLADCTPARTLGRILYTDLPSVREVTQGLPEDIAAAIDRALSRNPEDRYENCAAFAAALREALVRYERCEDESYEALLGHLTTRCVEPEALPLAARVRGPARARRWVVTGDHTELAFAA